MATKPPAVKMAPAVQNAAQEGNVAELRRLRVGEAGGEPVDATDSYCNTALHWAAVYGWLEAVQYMLQRGATVDLPNNNSKSTALHWAAFEGHAAVARELALRGADPRLTNQYGKTPLQNAERNGHGAAIGAAIEEGQRARAAAQVRHCLRLCPPLLSCPTLRSYVFVG